MTCQACGADVEWLLAGGLCVDCTFDTAIVGAATSPIDDAHVIAPSGAFL